MSKLYGSSIEDTLTELKNSGLDSIPGTAAEILVMIYEKSFVQIRLKLSNGRILLLQLIN